MTRFAVLGHVEWIEFGRFSHAPEPGEIIDATEWFSEAAGSATVVAVQLAKLSGDVSAPLAPNDNPAAPEPHRRPNLVDNLFVLSAASADLGIREPIRRRRSATEPGRRIREERCVTGSW